MTPHDSPRSERLLVLLLVLVFFVPLLTTVFVHFATNRPGWAGSLSRTIIGEAPVAAVVPAVPTATLAAVGKADYQETLAKIFNASFAGRNWIIRCTQELYIRLFHVASGPALLGRHNSTFWNDDPYGFLSEYCVQRPSKESLQPIVDCLKILQDNYRDRGGGLALVITPSKASIYPEDMPPAWRRRYDPRPRGYDQLVALLREAGVSYVDGHLLTQAAKKDASAPLFPEGGTHWGQYASFLTTNAVLHALQEQGQPVRPIDNARVIVTDESSKEDRDMVDAINPLFPWKFPVTRMSYAPIPLDEGRQPSLVLIGGSFVNSMGQHLYASGQFSEVHWLRYYRVSKEMAVPGEWKLLSTNLDHMDLDREVFAAQCLVMEINEQQIVNPVHLRQFFEDTIQRLPLRGSDAPRPSFTYDSYLAYHWGDAIRFAGGTTLAKPSAFSGFSGPEGPGCWTDRLDATVRLSVPDSEQDVLLSIDAGAVLNPVKLPVQHVSVFANGQAAGEWVYDTPGIGRRTMVIPRAFLSDGRLILRFHFDRTISPAELGDSGDQRQLALLVQQITLSQPCRRVDGPVLAAWEGPGKSPIFADNFSGSDSVGRWTTGRDATVRLSPPPAEARGAILSVEVGAAIVPKLLPVQHTGIFVNGQKVGEWVFDTGPIQRRHVYIPPALLGGDSLEVQFRFSKTISPTEAGTGNDNRRLALIFRSVQLDWFAPNLPSGERAGGSN